MGQVAELEEIPIVDRIGIQDIFATAAPRIERLPGNCVRITFCAEHSVCGVKELETVAQIVMPLVTLAGLWVGVTDQAEPIKLAS